MNLPKYRNINGDLLTYEQAAEKLNLGVGTVMKIAKDSGALVKIDKTTRIVYKEFLDYIINRYRVKNE